MNDENEDAAPDTVDWLFMFAVTIVVAMVLFNLIVSIFTDVYGTIKENKEAYDMEVLNEVTMDVENFCYILLFYRRFYKEE